MSRFRVPTLVVLLAVLFALPPMLCCAADQTVQGNETVSRCCSHSLADPIEQPASNPSEDSPKRCCCSDNTAVITQERIDDQQLSLALTVPETRVFHTQEPSQSREITRPADQGSLSLQVLQCVWLN